MTDLERIAQDLYAALDDARGRLTAVLAADHPEARPVDLDTLRSWENRLRALIHNIEHTGLLPD